MNKAFSNTFNQTRIKRSHNNYKKIMPIMNTKIKHNMMNQIAFTKPKIMIRHNTSINQYMKEIHTEQMLYTHQMTITSMVVIKNMKQQILNNQVINQTSSLLMHCIYLSSTLGNYTMKKSKQYQTLGKTNQLHNQATQNRVKWDKHIKEVQTPQISQPIDNNLCQNRRRQHEVYVD